MNIQFVIRLIVMSVLMLFGFMNVAFSEHEADHRYTLQGHVLDKQKKGIANSNVKVMLDGKFIAQKMTDSQGFYKAKLHLHDPDFGKELEIITDAGKGKVKIDFKLGDKKTERIHLINFVDGKMVEGEISNSAFPEWIYFLIGAVIVLVIVIVMGSKSIKKKKKKKKQKQKKKHK